MGGWVGVGRDWMNEWAGGYRGVVQCKTTQTDSGWAFWRTPLGDINGAPPYTFWEETSYANFPQNVEKYLKNMLIYTENDTESDKRIKDNKL